MALIEGVAAHLARSQATCLSKPTIALARAVCARAQCSRIFSGRSRVRRVRLRRDPCLDNDIEGIEFRAGIRGRPSVPAYSCRPQELSAKQPLCALRTFSAHGPSALLVDRPLPKDVQGGHAANLAVQRPLMCDARHWGCNRDRFRTFRWLMTTSSPSEKKPSQPGSRPLLQASKSAVNGGRKAWEWENNYPVMMSHCPTRSHCANPSGVLHSASLRYGDSA